MQPRLYLIRHGETEANREMRFPFPDTRLTRAGRLQAHRIGESFASRGILVETAIVSPTARAFETMEIALARAKLKPRVIVVGCLTEKDAGRAQGEPIPRDFHEVDQLAARGGGELFPEFIERVSSAFLSLLGEIRLGKWGEVAIFGHSLANRVCCGAILGMRSDAILASKGLENGAIKAIELQG